MSLSAPFPEPTARALPRVCRIREIFSPVSQFHRPIHSSLPFFFPTFWGTGFLFLAQLPLYLYTILKFLSAEFPQVLNLFLPRSIFPNFVSHSRDGCEIRVHCYYFVEALYITGSTQWHRPTGSWSTRKVCVGLEPPCWTRSIGIQHGFRVKQDAGHTS